ncbi:SDR family NAD(P)-dependent oxidoreductase [Streptomyces sp. NPDC005438]|uniref:SDR family NAD(P)-dependent oxidoreductase n=1 Tax=Streptomyces sp. NPDC005438 TaxID=3156880 RepID=UPI0033A3756E
MGRLRGYRALVTGAGRGIGEAIAVRLAAEGARVLVTDRDEASARAVAATIRADGGWARGEVCDVRDREAVDEVVRRAGAQLGGLELLVNNAFDGDPDPGSLIEETDEQWAKNLDVTLYGALRCCRAALPYLLLAEGRGSVVNIGSVNAAMDFGQHAYSAAKAGLESFTRTLAGQYAAQGVRVNLVAPGTVHTPNWIGRQEALERAAEHYPLGRVGRPEDIAAAVAFLASEDAAWITGISLPVDGGLSVSNLGLKRALSD